MNLLPSPKKEPVIMRVVEDPFSWCLTKAGLPKQRDRNAIRRVHLGAAQKRDEEIYDKNFKTINIIPSPRPPQVEEQLPPAGIPSNYDPRRANRSVVEAF
jgi:hypothetical protein